MLLTIDGTVEWLVVPCIGTPTRTRSENHSKSRESWKDGVTGVEDCSMSGSSAHGVMVHLQGEKSFDLVSAWVRYGHRRIMWQPIG
jgi:hypothetical protein